MENLVPLGTGNSRLMKSNIPASTTLAQLIQMLNNGTFPYDIGPLNSAGISQQGTPLNKDTLFSAQTQAKYPTGIEDPDGAFEKLASAALYQIIPKYRTLSDLEEGSIVSIKENGVPADFYVAKHDYESLLNGPGRTLVVRKDVYDQRQWHSSNVNAWASCTMRSWLNSTYKSLLDSDIQELMGTTTYYYTPGNGNWTVTTRSDAVFLLSGTELGKSTSYLNVEGSALPIASTLQIAYQGGSATTQWTRSPYTNDTFSAWGLYSSGSVNFSGCTITRGSRPAFTLPSNSAISTDPNVGDIYYPEQEYEQAITDLTGNILMTLPAAQIYTGSYTGTGTFGISNPNTLTFPFEPKFFVCALPSMGLYPASNNWQGSFIWHTGVNTAYVGTSNITISVSGNTLQWYSTSNDTNQLNNRTQYFYIAIG